MDKKLITVIFIGTLLIFSLGYLSTKTIRYEEKGTGDILVSDIQITAMPSKTKYTKEESGAYFSSNNLNNVNKKKYVPHVFAIIGDFGLSGYNEESVSNLVKSWNPEYILTTGDNNYPNGTAATIDINIGKYYHDYIQSYKGIYGNGSEENRFFPCLGNHDLDITGTPYYDYFSLPGNERYYDFIKNDIHFFSINSDPKEPDGTKSNSIQAKWLKNKLATSTSKWNIVYFHHPPYASDSVHGSMIAMRWPFKNWGADVVITGHSHFYERIMKDNLPYFTNGLGGESLLSKITKPVSGSQILYNSNFGAMQVSEKKDTLLFKFININNELIDSYPVVKSNS